MSDFITVTDVINEFGAYYKNSGKTKNDIKNKLFAKSEFENYVTKRTSTDTRVELTVTEIMDIIQAYQPGFTPAGGVTFKPRAINLDHFKIDVSLNVFAIANNWLDFMRNNELDPTKFPIVKYILEELIVKKARENFELKEIFHGVQGTVVPGTALGAGNIMNGFKKQILDGIAAGTMNRVLAADTIDASNIYDKLEAFDDVVSDAAPELEGVPMNFLMSHKMHKWFMRDKRAEGFYTVDGSKKITDDVDFTNNSVKPANAMNGSKIIFITPQWNIMTIRRTGTNDGSFDMQPDKRNVAIMGDYYIGGGFLIPEYVWAYVPADEMPSSGSGS